MERFMHGSGSAEVKFLRAIRPDPASLAYPFMSAFSDSGPRNQRDGLKAR
jgi:hypothetical protein